MGKILSIDVENDKVEIELREDFMYDDPEEEKQMKMVNSEVYKGNGVY